MRIVIASPVPSDSTQGNGVTARRWQRLLSELGHEVRLHPQAEVREDCDVLVALHARRSAGVIAAFVRDFPSRPVVLAMTGTDLYADLPDDADALASIARADRVVVLQPLALARLPVEARGKSVVIRQSVPDRPRAEPAGDRFDVCVLAHLREVKDPLLAARAAALLPRESRVHVTLAGAPSSDAWRQQAVAAAAATERFTWCGGVSFGAAAALLARSHVLVVTSRMEGGANVVAEAIATGVPVLATRMEGNLGMLGEDYPGFFPVGDADALAAAMLRAEGDAVFLGKLAGAVRVLRPMFAPDREREAWGGLLGGLAR